MTIEEYDKTVKNIGEMTDQIEELTIVRDEAKIDLTNAVATDFKLQAKLKEREASIPQAYVSRD